MHLPPALQAPPGIVSMYLGDDVGAVVESLVHGGTAASVDTKIDLNVVFLPKADRSQFPCRHSFPP